MRRGFSLLEVIIAITIISILSAAILQISQESIKYTEDSEKRFRDTAFLSIRLDKEMLEVKNDEIFLDELLKNRYKIKEDDLLYFKDKKIVFSVESERELFFEEEEEEFGVMIEKPQIPLPILVNLRIQDGERGGFLYRLIPSLEAR